MTPLTFDFMSGTDVSSRIYSRFWEENENMFVDLPYLFDMEMLKESHFVCLAGNQLVGSLALQDDPGNSGQNVWLKHVCVHPGFQNRGIASQLMANCFQYLDTSTSYHSLGVSSFSEEGILYLPQKIEDLSAKYPRIQIVWPGNYIPSTSALTL
jgi:GNAT superfamily N-acetyltransferase